MSFSPNIPTRPSPMPIGLGLSFKFTPGQYAPLQMSVPHHSDSQLHTRRPRMERENTLPVKVEDISINPSLLWSDEPPLPSEYDNLSLEYPPSSRFNAQPPDALFNPPFFTPKLTPSWSLPSMFPSIFTSPEDSMTSSSSVPRLLTASFSSLSNLSLSESPIKVIKTEYTIPQLSSCDPSLSPRVNFFTSCGSIDPAYITAPLGHSHEPYEDVFTSQGFRRTDYSKPSTAHGESPGKSYIRHLSRGYAPIPFFLPSLPPPRSPEAVPPPRVTKRKFSAQHCFFEEQTCSSSVESPILEAHRGISQVDLEAKARRYKMRNPCIEDLDNRWLASFTGKLSEHGGMIDDYRCYIVGCTQTNRRRDHMIVHVGSHLDQRTFKCSQCSSRFLRKNELKRHEKNHDASRPFACTEPRCTNTFRRSDLLARHLRNVHHVGRKDGKENKRVAKKAKLL